MWAERLDVNSAREVVCSPRERRPVCSALGTLSFLTLPWRWCLPDPALGRAPGAVSGHRGLADDRDPYLDQLLENPSVSVDPTILGTHLFTFTCQEGFFFKPVTSYCYLFIYLFMAVLGLRFCLRAFSSCGERGPLFIAVCGPLTIAASLVAEHRLQTCRLSSCGSRAQLLRGMWVRPRPGLEPVSPALAGRFSTTAPPEKPPRGFFGASLVAQWLRICLPMQGGGGRAGQQWLFCKTSGQSSNPCGGRWFLARAFHLRGRPAEWFQWRRRL